MDRTLSQRVEEVRVKVKAVRDAERHVESERAKLYFPGGEPRVPRETARHMERVLANDPDVVDGRKELSALRVAVHGELMAAAKEGEAHASRIGQDVSDWVSTSRLPAVAARLQLQAAYLQPMRDADAVGFLQDVRHTADRETALGWFLAGRLRFKDVIQDPGDRKAGSDAAGAIDALRELGEFAAPERIDREYADAVREIEELKEAARDVLAMRTPGEVEDDKKTVKSAAGLGDGRRGL